MTDPAQTLYYSITVFSIVFISGCAVNLLKRHYIFQLAGITFLFTLCLSRTYAYIISDISPDISELFNMLFPLLSGISACLATLTLGFWIFPAIRRKFRD